MVWDLGIGEAVSPPLSSDPWRLFCMSRQPKKKGLRSGHSPRIPTCLRLCCSDIRSRWSYIGGLVIKGFCFVLVFYCPLPLFSLLWIDSLMILFLSRLVVAVLGHERRGINQMDKYWMPQHFALTSSLELTLRTSVRSPRFSTFLFQLGCFYYIVDKYSFLASEGV